VREVEAQMSFGTAILLIVIALVFLYLIYAMLRPEKF
jgi:K+-transporting ATPase KdpF subunit